jgi:hypothetical protein
VEGWKNGWKERTEGKERGNEAIIQNCAVLVRESDKRHWKFRENRFMEGGKDKRDETITRLVKFIKTDFLGDDFGL